MAGLLLFGTAQALRRCFPMMRIDYIRVPGRQWVEDPGHRFDTLEIRAPLLTGIRRAEAAVRDELMQSFSLPEGALAREDEPALPLRVIREAIVNAVMHRSYRIHGAIQIIRYANRLEVRNPGHSIKAEEQLGEPGSETRNPRIATVLHEVNVAETKGSGIRAMRELMQQHGLLPPTFESSRRPDQFVATFLFHHFLGADDLAWLRASTAEALSDEESRALVAVRELGAIDNAAYRNINRTDTLNASVHLRRLRDLGLLTMKGSGSRTYYEPGPGFQSVLKAPEAAQPPQPGTANPPGHPTNPPAPRTNPPGGSGDACRPGPPPAAPGNPAAACRAAAVDHRPVCLETPQRPRTGRPAGAPRPQAPGQGAVEPDGGRWPAGLHDPEHGKAPRAALHGAGRYAVTPGCYSGPRLWHALFECFSSRTEVFVA